MMTLDTTLAADDALAVASNPCTDGIDWVGPPDDRLSASAPAPVATILGHPSDAVLDERRPWPLAGLRTLSAGSLTLHEAVVRIAASRSGLRTQLRRELRAYFSCHVPRVDIEVCVRRVLFTVEAHGVIELTNYEGAFVLARRLVYEARGRVGKAEDGAARVFPRPTNGHADVIVPQHMATLVRQITRFLAYHTADQDADDLVQNVFEHLVVRDADEGSASRVRGWKDYAFGVARNHVLRYLRARGLDGKIEDIDGVELADPRTWSELDLRLDTLIVGKHVAALRNELRDVIDLYYFKEMPMKAIGEHLKRSESIVRYRLQQAHEALLTMYLARPRVVVCKPIV